LPADKPFVENATYFWQKHYGEGGMLANIPLPGGRGTVVFGTTPPPQAQIAIDARKIHNCGHCGKTGSHLQKCGACGLVHYCNRECQLKAWGEHRESC